MHVCILFPIMYACMYLNIKTNFKTYNLITKQPRMVPQHIIQATTSEELGQAPYTAARAGFEPVTLWTQGTELTTEPPGP